MTTLQWFSMKQMAKKTPVESKISPKVTFSLYEITNVPLTYVCISPYHMMPVLNNELIISKDGIKFEFLHKFDILNMIKVEIKTEFIQTIMHSKTNNLLKISLEPDVYTQYFSNNPDELFDHSIWLCLKYDNLSKYLSQMKNLGISAPIADKEYLSFKFRLYKRNPGKEFVTRWEDVVTDCSKINIVPSLTIDDVTLSSTFNDIKLSPGKTNGPTSPSSAPSCIHHSQTPPITSDPIEVVKEKMKRKPLKRSITVPVVTVPVKKQRVSSRTNRTLLYSPSPKHSMEITDRDLLCLHSKKYLNDNVINVYLTYIYHELLSPDQREASYFFNVFFNTKLIGSPAQQRLDTPEMRHARVAKWTKNVDIFSKDFIVIPVIEDDHWFLVIVCFPWMSGIIDYTKMYAGTNKAVSSIPKNDSDFAMNVRFRKMSSIEENNVKAYPCILILDSLEARNRTGKVNIIRDYLKSEWDSKRKAKDGPLIFDRTTCRGYCPVVLKQNNGTDCGVYLLQYVESFFKNAPKKFDRETFTLGFFHWFDRPYMEGKREEIKRTILDKSKEVQREENEDNDDGDMECLNIL